MNWLLIRRPLMLGALMCIAAGLTIAATPTSRMADEGPKIDLERMIPEKFGDWRIDRSITPLLVAPDVQAKLDKIYNQTLARTYINSRGERAMLSIAYGGDQSDSMRAHRPEVCYTAQGFQVVRTLMDRLTTKQGTMPVKRLVAVNGPRIEPITYWMVVGDRIALNTLEQKFAQIRFGLTGTVPDGVLVRVSTISDDTERAFSVQDGFLRDLLGALGPDTRLRVAGAGGVV
jgi:EpsI family protein